MSDFLTSNSKNFFKSYADKIEQKKGENIYSDYFSFSDDNISYNNIWDLLGTSLICASADLHDGGELLESVSLYQTVDLIGEGEVEGVCDKNGDLIRISNDPSKNENLFKGIYLNDIPVKNTYSESLNYNRVFTDIRLGTFDQDLLSSFEKYSLSFTNSYQSFEAGAVLYGLNRDNFNTSLGSELWTTLNGKVIGIFADSHSRAASFKGNHAVPVYKNNGMLQSLKSAEKFQNVRFSHLVTNDNVLLVNVNMALSMSGNFKGDTLSNSVNFVIKVGYDGDETLLGDGGSVVYVYCSIDGIATSEYVRTFTIPLPPSIEGIDRKVTVFRVDGEVVISDTTSKGSYNKSLVVKSISEILPEKINYTNSCVIGSIVDARGFSRIPKRTYDMKLTKIKVPSNYDPETKIYSGDWNGEFKKDLYWTDNPAWILYDLMTNKKHGLAKYDFKKSYVNKWNLYSIAKYCDELVPTGESSFVDPLDFTIDSEGTKVTFDDSSSLLGEESYMNRYPEGATVCLYQLNTESNGSGTDIDTGYKRIVYKPVYNNTTNAFSFTILSEPPSTEIFETYPSVKRSYILDPKGLSARNWIISNWINSQDSDEKYISDYTVGLAISPTAKSGKAIVQSFSNYDILESRFSCNIYMDRFQQALEAMNTISSIFKGITYWANNSMFVSHDKKKDAIMLFNNANVKNGLFSYSSSAKTARSTAVLVRYNDKTDNFKSKVTYIEDSAGMREYGFLLKEVAALGVTSKTQAKRIAKWSLYTEQTETDLVQFSTGTEGSILMPQDVVKIQDKLKSTKRYGGRIVDLNYAAKQITLDKGIKENIVGQTLTVVLPRENKTMSEINKESKSRVRFSLDALPQSELDKQRQSQIKQYTIASVTDNKVITISETTDEDFNSLKRGFLWSAQNNSSSLGISETEYRVLNVIESTQNEYQVTCMLYNESKFEAIDLQKNLTEDQDSQPQKVIVSSLPSALSGSVASEGLEIATSDYYDSRFTSKKTDFDVEMKVNFSELIGPNILNSENTGGYVVEVYKDGQKVRFALDGYDNTEFVVFLGDRRSFKNTNYEIYRYDTDYKLEDLGI